MNRHFLLVIFVLLNTINTFLFGQPHWNYGEIGPDVWKDYYPTCGSNSQSPINIQTACVTYQSFQPFQFSSAYDLIQNFTLTNNGHTITAQQVNPSVFSLMITGGGLTEPFQFQNFHLHWGENYNSGSEHQINGLKYSGEIHFVHSNAAQTQVAVLGVFMETIPPTNMSQSDRRRKRDVYNTDNSTINQWENYFTVANQLNYTNSSAIISLKLSTLMGNDLNNFYRYSGSLTTPPCTQNVIWTVFQIPIGFTDPVFNAFRSNIYLEDFRSPQPVNGRFVYRNFPNDTVSSIPDYNCCSAYGTNTNQSNSSSNGNSILLINRQFSSFFYFFIFLIFLI